MDFRTPSIDNSGALLLFVQKIKFVVAIDLEIMGVSFLFLKIQFVVIEKKVFTQRKGELR